MLLSLTIMWSITIISYHKVWFIIKVSKNIDSEQARRIFETCDQVRNIHKLNVNVVLCFLIIHIIIIYINVTHCFLIVHIFIIHINVTQSFWYFFHLERWCKDLPWRVSENGKHENKLKQGEEKFMVT